MAASSSSSSAEYDRTKKSTSADSQKIEELTSKINQLLKSSQRGVHQVDETAEPVQFLEGPEPEGDREVNFIYGQGFGQNRGYNPNFRGNNNNYLSYRSTNVANPQDQKYPPAQPGQYQPFRPANSNQDFQRNNQGYRPYQGNQYQRGPQPQAPYPNPNEDLKGMMQQLLQQQQKMDVDIQDKMGTMYNDLNGKIEALTTHMKMVDTQLAQTAEAIQREQGTLPGKAEQNPKKEVFSIRIAEGEPTNLRIKKVQADAPKAQSNPEVVRQGNEAVRSLERNEEARRTSIQDTGLGGVLST